MGILTSDWTARSNRPAYFRISAYFTLHLISADQLKGLGYH